MAKIVKVKMTRVQNGGWTQNSYPAEYVDTKIKVWYEDINDVSKDYLIGVVKDEDLEAFTASPDIEEITQETAIALGTVWRPQVKKITDVDVVLSILEKVRNSLALTQAEKDAIDPDNAAKGINKSSLFTDVLTDAITKVG